MADNVILPGTGTNAATDDIGGVHYQRVKIAHGADGSATDTSSASPLPVGASQVAATVPAATVLQNAVSATGNGSTITCTGYGTAVVQISGTFVATVNFEVSNDAGTTWNAISATAVGAGTISNTATAVGQYRLTVTGFDLLRARVTWTSGTSLTARAIVTNAVNSSKIVQIASNQTVPVSGIFWQATQPVSFTWAGLTDTQLRASAVPVSGTVTANAGTGTMAVSAASLPLPSGAATETTLAALNTKMPAQGQAVMASSQPVVIASNQSAIPVAPPAALLTSYNVAGVIAINTVLMTLDCSQWRSISIQCISMGTTGVVTPEWSNDNTNWVTATILTQAGVTATTFNAAGLWVAPVHARYMRLRLSTATTAGTTTLSVHQLDENFSNWLATQPVSGTVTANIGTGSIAAGTNAIGDVGVQYRANATGAASFVSAQSPATPAVGTIKASAGRLIGWQLQNSSTGVRSVKIFNATAPTLGTTAASFEIDLAAGQRSDVQLPGGIGFATAITWSATSAKGLTDNTATGLALNDVSGAFYFA